MSESEVVIRLGGLILLIDYPNRQAILATKGPPDSPVGAARLGLEELEHILREAMARKG